jgi:hypothetical protein
MAEHPNIIKLRTAGIPAYVYGWTLEMKGYAGLQELISAREYLQNGVLKNFFLNAGNLLVKAQHGIESNAVIACNLMAKHLCLSGVPVCVTSVTGILNENRRRLDARDQSEQYRAVFGKGYLVIPDFVLSDISGIWTEDALRAVADTLMAHVQYGGGLVLGGKDYPEHIAAVLGYDLHTLLQHAFAYYPVNQGQA